MPIVPSQKTLNAIVRQFLPHVGPNCVAFLAANSVLRIPIDMDMNLKDEFLKEILENYFQKSLMELLPSVVRESIAKSKIRQEYISLNRAIKKYDLSRRTLYYYHERKYITLHTTEGKTFVSVIELEEHIRRHPLPRKVA